MSGAAKPPTGTVQAVKVPASYCCGCVHRQVLILLLAVTYLALCVLSGVAVWAGINDNQSHYNGEVKIDLNNYTVTKVGGSPLKLSVGWLKYTDGKSKNLRDLSDLSTGAAVLGFLMAFMLLVSVIITGWKFLFSCCIRRGHKSGGTCLYLLISAILIGLQFAFLVVTSRDMDDYAHKQLGVNPNNDIAMAPGYAWNCGTAAAFLWIFAAILNGSIPTQQVEEYHKF